MQPSMAKERPPHPATIGRTVIQRMEKDSGRSPGELWKLFVGYRKDQAKEIEDEFLKQGYTIENVSKAVTTAIRALGLDLPAHGTGGTDSGVQGDLDEAVKVWVSKLTQWAKDNPKSEKKKTKGRQQTEEQKTKTDTKKSEKKQNSKDQKHIDWHNKNPHKKCSRPGCKL